MGIAKNGAVASNGLRWHRSNLHLDEFRAEAVRMKFLGSHLHFAWLPPQKNRRRWGKLCLKGIQLHMVNKLSGPIFLFFIFSHRIWPFPQGCFYSWHGGPSPGQGSPCVATSGFHLRQSIHNNLCRRCQPSYFCAQGSRLCDYCCKQYSAEFRLPSWSGSAWSLLNRNIWATAVANVAIIRSFFTFPQFLFGEVICAPNRLGSQETMFLLIVSTTDGTARKKVWNR